MANNLAEVYKESSEKFGTKPAFWYKNAAKEYQAITYKELYEDGLALAEALIDLGVDARDHVGILADNRKEWIVADCAVLLAGAANVPRGSDITDSEIVYILNHSGAKIVFIENDKVYEKFKNNKSQIKGAKTVIILDQDSKIKSGSGVLHFPDLLKKGKELRNKGKKEAEKRISKIKPDDLFTLIYTSGTTGMPKGVMLMHSNMIHQLHYVVPNVAKVTPEDRMLSILPVWHIFERVVEYFAIVNGGSTYYTKVTDLRNDIQKARPTFMASAPRVWESIYNGIYTRINDPKQTPPVRRLLFKVAYFFSKHYHSSIRFLKGLEVDYENRNIIQSLIGGAIALVKLLVTAPFSLTILGGIVGYYLSSAGNSLSTVAYVISGLGLILNVFTLDRIVLSKIRQATGGHLRATLSGGGALQKHVDAFFMDIGITVLEGYGMTETSPVISVRSFERPVMGSVGDIVPLTQVQIRDDAGKVLCHIDDKRNIISGKQGLKGVVHLNGPQVMKGYYKNPEATAKTIVDGWLNTGDIGMINFKKTLTLTGRAKDTIVLLGGENVEPVPIENKIDESPFIKQSMVVGQDQKVLGAIIVPDFDALTAWAADNGITETKPEKLITEPKVVDFYKKEVRNFNSVKTGFKNFEQVQYVTIITKPFEVGDELTNLMKMKRHVITEKYKDRILELYKNS
ncbi:AMP-dependent synthetase/ligase [Leptospira ilyithenensis]|uniref:Long-chain fatty acid--CoA ligase n=1 Tax=Leptospira ilyithenensis TaxID=2484901 RepID=A0A4R9LNY7_9LEPT|nr:long-chain fatty acid--CoA ligase [Leptospira ilyithenensis]TGN08718.1 long-chain fatty acid--CoA ligase [Leptospira ilyithenensis]